MESCEVRVSWRMNCLLSSNGDRAIRDYTTAQAGRITCRIVAHREALTHGTIMAAPHMTSFDRKANGGRRHRGVLQCGTI